MRASLALLATLTLVAGCASNPSPSADNNADYNRISESCKARGGMLTPIPGAHNANEAANYACEFRGKTPPKA
ncbi:MAG: hypothetical protein JSR45_05175 [Proteobacteria bacterium]|nr:hypothetical protein [Pseudomonadota bacterium]